MTHNNQSIDLAVSGDNTVILFTFQYDRYQRFGTEEYVLKNGGVLCPQPDCGMGILPMDDVCNKIACTYGCGVSK